MIEIMETTTEYNLQTFQPSNRAAMVVITNTGQSFMLLVGNLPLAGDLQAALDARETELWAAAQESGEAVDLYSITPKRVLKAVALVILDEINILRQRAGLALRTPGMIDDAVKAKLKGMQ